MNVKKKPEDIFSNGKKLNIYDSKSTKKINKIDLNSLNASKYSLSLYKLLESLTNFGKNSTVSVKSTQRKQGKYQEKRLITDFINRKVWNHRNK